MSNEMTPKQQRLYDLLVLQTGDVSITQCYSTVFAGTYLSERRDMQMKLGPLITRINRKIVDQRQRIEPGALKGTYRLNTNYQG